MNKNEIGRNILASFIMQFVALVNGLVLPKIILTYFGSDVNGLISSVNQFLNYVSLLEAGLGGVIMASLYKPLYEKDTEKINQIVSAAQGFFKSIGIISLVYTIILAITYPKFVNTGFSYPESILLICVLGGTVFFQYYFAISYKLLLNADRKVYIVSLSQALITLLSLVSAIVIAKLYPNIIIIKIVSGTIFLLQPLIFTIFTKRHYPYIHRVGYSKDTIKNKWDGLGINIAAFIHNNTDIVILTLFCSLSDVSVYAIHLMVINAIKSLLQAISGAIVPSLGKVLAKGNQEEINIAFDEYSYFTALIVTIAFSCTFVLLTPFVSLYTANITDTNYYHPIFAVLLAVSEFIYCFRDPYIGITYAAGKYKEISKYAYLEAVINISISLVLVGRYKFIGVAIGTIIAMAIRMLCQMFYLEHNIIYRSLKKSLKSIIVFGFCAMLTYLIGWIAGFNHAVSYFDWIIKAGIVMVCSVCITSMVSLILYRNLFIRVCKSILNRI